MLNLSAASDRKSAEVASNSAQKKPTASAANNNNERVLDEYLSLPLPPCVCVWRQIRFLRLYAKHFLCIKKQKRKRTTTAAQEGCCKQERGRGRATVTTHRTQKLQLSGYGYSDGHCLGHIAITVILLSDGSLFMRFLVWKNTHTHTGTHIHTPLISFQQSPVLRESLVQCHHRHCAKANAFSFYAFG